MPSLKVLILGGTGEACELADQLAARGHHPVTSLAGVTGLPRLPAGEARIGSLGGPEGLARVLGEEQFDAMVDATHPFAAQISGNACRAAATARVTLIRLERPAWTPTPADRWMSVSNVAEAAAILPEQARVFLTIGRKGLAAFMARPGISGAARMIEAPQMEKRPGWTLILARPPFSELAERALMQQHGFTHLVSKNAGGSATETKLLAARSLALPVVMIERPSKPEVETVADTPAVIKRLEEIFYS